MRGKEEPNEKASSFEQVAVQGRNLYFPFAISPDRPGLLFLGWDDSGNRKVLT